jgi:hypothetical protein
MHFAAPDGADAGGGFDEAGLGARANGDFGAFAGQFFGNGSTQSFAGRGDNRHASTQAQFHADLLSKLFMFSRFDHSRQINLGDFEGSSDEPKCAVCASKRELN